MLFVVCCLPLVVCCLSSDVRRASLRGVRQLMFVVCCPQLFGAGGSGNFLTRLTAVFATVFFVLSLVLGNMSTHKTESQWVDPTQGQVIQQADDAASEVPAPTGNEIPQ